MGNAGGAQGLSGNAASPHGALRAGGRRTHSSCGPRPDAYCGLVVAGLAAGLARVVDLAGALAGVLDAGAEVLVG